MTRTSYGVMAILYFIAVLANAAMTTPNNVTQFIISAMLGAACGHCIGKAMGW